VFRTALETEVAPALSALGFDVTEPGGCTIPWNDAYLLATNIRESKYNQFGAEQFDVLFSIWMIEEPPDRRVRGIWLPIPQQWSYDDPEAMTGIGGRLLDGIVRSAIPLATEKYGPPSDDQIAELAARTELSFAREIGEWHVPGGDGWGYPVTP